MKRLITLSFVFVQLVSFAQIEDWYQVDLSRLGYKHTTFTFENIPVLNNNNNTTSGNFSQTKVKGGSFELSVDIYTKHMYFSFDGSSFLDLGATLFQFNKTKERWWKNANYNVDRSDLLPVRLAFGSNIGKYVGLYAGGQYAYSLVGLSYTGASESYRNTFISGNTYGFGGHLVGAYRFLNVRYSYMYNWQAQAKTFRGNAITNELVISAGLASVGIFAKFTHMYSMSRAGYLPVDRTKILKNDYANKPGVWQSAHYATQFQFSVGIYAAGLFSGITKAGSNALMETEQGLAKERREDKRRKMEYKER